MRGVALLGVGLALLGCYHPDAHVSGSYAPHDAAPTPSSGGAGADDPRQPCALADGAIHLEIPVPRGYALAVSPEACMLVDERSESPVFVSFSAIPGSSERAEDALLAEQPDGVRRWALATKLLGAGATPGEQGQTRLLGSTRPYFVLHATPPGLDVPRDALLLAIDDGEERLVVLVVAPPDDVATRAALLMLVAQVTR